MRALERRDWLPNVIKNPKDRAMREKANLHETFNDPGNLHLNLVHSVLRVWEHADVFGQRTSTRIDTREYGAAANRSARGATNLRGNQIEAWVGVLQAMGSRGPRALGRLKAEPKK